MIDREALDNIVKNLPATTTLVAVSKFVPVETIEAAYNLGITHFGENRVQEFVEKVDKLPSDIEWHFIGNLQTNKVKDIVGKVALIHSVDRVRLLNRINNEALKKEVTVDILLQLDIAEEETKAGFSREEILEVMAKMDEWEGVNILGLMGMASFSDNMEQVEREFLQVRELFDEIISAYPHLKESFTHLSMGMSSDYEVALKQGSTLVRIGSTIFGARE